MMLCYTFTILNRPAVYSCLNGFFGGVMRTVVEYLNVGTLMRSTNSLHKKLFGVVCIYYPHPHLKIDNWFTFPHT
jgi:hypothetical protein